MKTQFITDNHGNKLAVVLPIKEYKKIIEDLEDLADARLYDKVKKNDTGERIPMNEVCKLIENKRRKKKNRAV